MRDDFICIAWGALAAGELTHMDCPVVVADKVCPCECQTCKRAWFKDGQPVMRDGKIVRR